MTDVSRLAVAMEPRVAGELLPVHCVGGGIRVLPSTIHVISGQIVAIDYGIVRVSTADERRDFWDAFTSNWSYIQGTTR
jgi:hypothetical protein